MELSKRLQAIADMVTPGNSLVDVGCDHGYLPIYLLKTGIIPRALACDINKGPLEAAQKNIAHYGLDGRSIETRLSDGLMEVEPFEGKTLTIAGMGGRLIIGILSNREDTFGSFEEIILSPQSEIHEVRRFVVSHGFYISDEDLIREDGKYYFIMKLKPDTLPAVNGIGAYAPDDSPNLKKPGGFCSSVPGKKDYSKADYLYGPCLIKKRHPMLREYLLSLLGNLNSILVSLEEQDRGSTSNDRRRNRILELQDEISEIHKILDLYQEK